ncbi:MAG TPA: amidohydrolase family protein [Solirubrobacteraceae bacterium]|jgi:L-fuconolactonase|nr:amidohydrolase family protein [Solirubrobacteraceae bacterium]
MTAAARIDAHHHVWDLGVRDQAWTAGLPALRRSFSLDDLRPSMAAHRIDATVLVQTVCVPEETIELLELATREPQVAGVVGWVELSAPTLSETLARLKAGPGGGRLVGIRHQVQEEPDPSFLKRREVRRGLRAVAEAGLVYELLVRERQLNAAVDVTRALPELRFVLDHAAKPEVDSLPTDGWTRAIESLAALPNVVVKLSGLTSEAPSGWTLEMLRPFADTLLSRFGPKRLMFGSDWPVCILGGGYDVTIAATEALTQHCDESERRAMFGGVAVETYGLRL